MKKKARKKPFFSGGKSDFPKIYPKYNPNFKWKLLFFIVDLDTPLKDTKKIINSRNIMLLMILFVLEFFFTIAS